MRLVLFVSYPGDGYECGGSTEVYPIEHEDKELAQIELASIIIDRKAKWLKHCKEHGEWIAGMPAVPPVYNGMNQTVIKKHERLDQEFEDAIAKWKTQEPPWVNRYEEIEFCGCKFAIDSLDEDDVTIMTVDEWFEQGYF